MDSVTKLLLVHPHNHSTLPRYIVCVEKPDSEKKQLEGYKNFYPGGYREATKKGEMENSPVEHLL